MADPRSTVTAAPVNTFQLTPPEVIVPVPAETAPQAVPLADATKAAVDDQVARFIDALMTENVHSPEFKQKLDSAFAQHGARHAESQRAVFDEAHSLLTFPARPSRKSRTRSFASGELCAMPAISASVKNP